MIITIHVDWCMTVWAYGVSFLMHRMAYDAYIGEVMHLGYIIRCFVWPIMLAGAFIDGVYLAIAVCDDAVG